jgi:Uma2 family endonuclease
VCIPQRRNLRPVRGRGKCPRALEARYAPCVSRVAERSKLTAAEYLAWERAQPVKHEFFDGEVFAMAGGSPRHNALCVRTTIALNAALHGRGCVEFSSDQRIGIDGGTRYVYPDVSVVCGGVQLQGGTSDVIVNPRIIVEVLSQGTEQYDRGLKWESYQGLPSLTDYVLVSQWEARVEHYRRDAGGRWSYRPFGPGERLELTDGAVLDVDAIFAGVFELPGD